MWHEPGSLLTVGSRHLQCRRRLGLWWQVAYSLLDRRPQNGMAEYCRQHNIAILPYGVVAGGLLSDRYLGADASECVPPPISPFSPPPPPPPPHTYVLLQDTAVNLTGRYSPTLQSLRFSR